MKKISERAEIFAEGSTRLSPERENEIALFLMMFGQALLWDLHAIDCVGPVNLAGTHTRAVVGKKYVRLDYGNPDRVAGWNGRFMADLSTGEIFGIKSYGVPHKGKRYGTLSNFDTRDLMVYRKSWEKKGCPGLLIENNG